MRIAFLDFYPAGYLCDTPLREPLGGTQSAVAYLTAALAARGHEVTVANAVDAPARSQSVDFVGRDRLTASFFNSFDLVVVVGAAVGRDLRDSGVTVPAVLWCHHDADQRAVARLQESSERAAWDGFAVLSQYQAARYSSMLGVEPSRIRLLGNAAAPSFSHMPAREPWFARGAAPVLYYTSTPFRGLELLIEAMPLIRKAVPGVRLQVFSGMRLYGLSAAEDEYSWLYDKCRATAGVDYVGPLPQRALAAALQAADVHAYPCTFPETACIAAMESMAAGALIVSTRFGALEETTAGFAHLIEGSEHEPLRPRRYAEFLVQCLSDAARQSDTQAARLRDQQRFAQENYTWEKRALEWERWLSTEIAKREHRALMERIPELAAKAEGNLLKAAGDAGGAIGRYGEALRTAPGYAPALYNLGMTLHESGRYEEAEACFRQVLALEPEDPDALFHLGALLERRFRLGEGAELYRKALALRPEDIHLWMRLGLVALARFTDASLREAESCFRKAIDLQPGQASGHQALGHAFTLQGRHAEAAESLNAAHRLESASVALQADLLHAKQQLCDWQGFPELSAAVCRAAVERPRDPPHPFSLTSIESTPAQQLACARSHARSIVEPLASDARRLELRFSRRDGHRRRIGYLSPEFHAHATAYLAAELFELHDRERFEIIAYSYGPEDGSPMRARLARAFDRFRDVQSVPDAALAAAVHADEVDILVDLKGYTFRARTGVMALRPAPIQVNFLGYPGTMGAEFIDYLIGDRIVTPAARAGDFSETLVLMPGSYQVNDRKRTAAPTPPRDELELPAGGFVFCSFNQAYKILPEVFAAWMRLLQAVPASVLWLLDSAAAANLRREARARGVDPARLVFAPPLPHERHLGRFAAADLFLDTFPYNAHTTASDALWAGVPLVTLAGETFASRVAASLLEAVGLPELATRSLADYEALALRLARAPGELRALRERLMQARVSAPLFDTPRYVRSLEAAYERMWEAYRSGATPRRIEL